jgi:hypothetical protein
MVLGNPCFKKESLMKKTLCAMAFLLPVAALLLRAAPDEKEMPKPGKEHEWLRQFEGTWAGDLDMLIDPMDPGKKLDKPLKSKMTESTTMLGGWWAMPVVKGEMMGETFEGRGQYGYDAEKKKYIGTWIDSMMPHLWLYEGSLDASGKTLTLEAKGPDCLDPTRMVKYRDVHEFVDRDTRRMSSAIEREGKWVPIMRGELKRTK